VGAYGSWLRQLAVNVWLKYARDAEPFSELDDDLRHESSMAMEHLDLDSALGALPPTFRLSIVLAYHESMSHGEIAIATGIPLGTVKSNITRGTRRLRELLAAYNSASEDETHV
jgi:DNA-directed RNA polymerase specialized sigma24 family protein